MDTREHTELGNALRLKGINKNPYIRTDENGVLYFRLQRLRDPQAPEPMSLELSAGEIIAMAGDYFTQADWTMNLTLPHCEPFESPVRLGEYLINQTITQEEQSALLSAYNNLAAPDVTREQIELIYDINSSDYIPFSSTLNSYMQQLMLYFRVKNYGEMITRNQTHFTPWSIKAYVLGHSIALRYAQLACELKHYAYDENYSCDNPDFVQLQARFKEKKLRHSTETILDSANRYEALAYCMELFTFHYYSDHFATGHMSMIADLRVELQSRFGVLGSILANNLHDEVNRVGVFTNNPYSTKKDKQTAPIRSRGDGTFDTCLNKKNRRACIKGMTSSLADVQSVLQGGTLPNAQEFGGLNHLPDVDFDVRQHQPLLIYSNKKIYRREHPSQISIMSPKEYEDSRTDPTANGYVEVSNKWDAFVLVTKLRLFPYLYKGKVQPVSDEKQAKIEFEESQRRPLRKPIPPTRCRPEKEPNALDWRQRKDPQDGLNKHSILQFKHHKHRHHHRQHEPLEGSKLPFRA